MGLDLVRLMWWVGITAISSLGWFVLIALFGLDLAHAQTITALADEDRTMFVGMACAILYALGVMVGRR